MRLIIAEIMSMATHTKQENTAKIMIAITIPIKVSII